ncbi:retrovirus-related pol polyprotein from transposon TNT 1-94 [Tanacetum coccineum]
MEAAMEQCSVNRKCCEIQHKQFLIENDRLLEKIISQEIVNIVLNSSVIICDSEKKNENSVDTCNKCLELEVELEHADILREIVKSDRALSHLNSNLDSACLFDANHDKCVLDYVIDVNVLSKSKPAKRKNKKQIWKPTVPLKETTTKSVLTPTQEIMVYSRRPKATKSIGCPNCSVIAKIMGYGDYQIGNVTISRVYYVEGLRHNLFFVGVDLLMGSRGTNLYTLSIGDIMKSSPICLLSKASKTKSWLWHRRLSHLNFGTINQLDKQGLVRGLLKLKFEKYHLCSACSLGKSKKQSHKPKSEDTNQEKLSSAYGSLWADSCRKSKDEALEFINKFLKMIQVRLNATVKNIRIDNEAVATTCYTQNHSLIRLCHEKTLNELLHDKKPDLSYLYVFGALYYPTNDIEDLGKLKAKADVDFDELTTMASKQSSSRPALHDMTPGTLSSEHVPQPPLSTPFVPPIRDDCNTLLQPLFGENFRPPPCVDHPVPEVAALVPAAIATDTPSSTFVDQDAPSPSTLQTPQESPSQVIPPSVEEADHDIEVAHMNNNPQFGIPVLEPSFE